MCDDGTWRDVGSPSRHVCSPSPLQATASVAATLATPRAGTSQSPVTQAASQSSAWPQPPQPPAVAAARPGAPEPDSSLAALAAGASAEPCSACPSPTSAIAAARAAHHSLTAAKSAAATEPTTAALIGHHRYAPDLPIHELRAATQCASQAARCLYSLDGHEA
jgi:hypothetical protein